MAEATLTSDLGFDRERQQDYRVTPFRVREGGRMAVVLNILRANTMFRLLQTSCSDFINEDQLYFEKRLLERDLSSGNTFGVLLKAGNRLRNKLVGFIYARPASEIAIFEKERDDFLARGGTEAEFVKMRARTAAVMWTLVHPGYRQRGGLSAMAEKFDEELLDGDKFDYLVCQVRNANGLADAVARRYGDDKIEYRKEVPDSPYGPQTYFRIRLR